MRTLSFCVPTPWHTMPSAAEYTSEAACSAACTLLAMLVVAAGAWPSLISYGWQWLRQWVPCLLCPPGSSYQPWPAADRGVPTCCAVSAGLLAVCSRLEGDTSQVGTASWGDGAGSGPCLSGLIFDWQAHLKASLLLPLLVACMHAWCRPPASTWRSAVSNQWTLVPCCCGVPHA